MARAWVLGFRFWKSWGRAGAVNEQSDMPFAAVETGSVSEVSRSFQFGQQVAVRHFVRGVHGEGEFESLERWICAFDRKATDSCIMWS